MSFESPVSILANEEGNLVALSASQAMPSEQPGLPVMGKDASGNAQFLKLTSTGELVVSASVDIDLDYTTDSVTVYGNLAALRQEGGVGEERLMVSGAVDMAGPGFDSLLSAVNNVSGAVDNLGADLNSMNSNLGTKLDTLDTSVGDVETAVNNASSAISGSVVALGADLGAKLDTLNAVDFATETTLSGFKSENNTNLVALSSSLDRFNFSGGALSVTGNLDVNVGLTASGSAEAGYLAYDTVNIFGDEGVPFSQISGSGEMITVPLGSEKNSLLQAASGSIWSDVNGNGALLVGLLGSNSKEILQSSVNDILLVSGAGNFNVVASDLDIRDLNSATDSVTVYQGTNPWTVNDSTVSGAIDNLGITVGGVTTAVNAVSSAIDSLGGGISLVNLSSSLGDINNSVLAVSGALAEMVGDGRSTSATVTSIAGSAGTASVAASDVRKGIIFYMEGNNTAYVKFGSGATNSDYSVAVVGPGGLYELSELRYTGNFSVAFKTLAGTLRITELE